MDNSIETARQKNQPSASSLEAAAAIDALAGWAGDRIPPRPSAAAGGGPETTPLALVTTAQGVSEMLALLLRCDTVSIDVEHEQERSFYGRICLLQLSAPGHGTFLVDCMEPEVRSALAGGVGGLSLKSLTADPAVLKLLHGGLSDIRWLQHGFGAHLVNMFDTQEAAKVMNARLGAAEQLPLALGQGKTNLPGLAEHSLGVPPTPKLSQEDWSQRPLPIEMAYYAAADAHHLLPLSQVLWARLADFPGALAQVETACRALCKTLMVYRVPADTGENPWSNDANFKRHVSKAALPPEFQPVLCALYLWRDREERRRDDKLVCTAQELIAVAHGLAEANADTASADPAALAGDRLAVAVAEMRQISLQQTMESFTAAAMKRLEEFVRVADEGGPDKLVLEPELSAREQLCYHLLCEQPGLDHLSSGLEPTRVDGSAGRQLTISIRAPAAKEKTLQRGVPDRSKQKAETRQPMAARPIAASTPDRDTYKAAHMLLLDGQGRMLTVRDSRMQRKADRAAAGTGNDKGTWTNLGGKKHEQDRDESWATLLRVARDQAGLDLSDTASFRPLFRKYQPDEHRICYLVCARAETLELPLGELRPGKNVYTAAEWLPADRWRPCLQWDFRLKAAVNEYRITAASIDLAAIFAQPALALGAEIPEHFARQRGGNTDGPPKPPQPPPGFGQDWWRKQVCSRSQPVPDYPAAEIRDVLNTAAAGRWAGLGDPMLELMVRRRLAQHATDGATCAACANKLELLVLPKMIEGSREECLYCQTDQFVTNSSLAKIAGNWLVPAFGHNNDRTGAWQASSSADAPNDHKKGTAVEAMLGVVGLKAGLEVAASLYADKVTGLPDWHAAAAPQQIDPPVELHLPWILDQAVGPAASLLTASGSRWAQLHFLGEAATSLCLMHHHFVTHPGADKGRLHELHKNNKGVGTIERVSLARAAKEAGLGTWLDDACTKSGLEMCVRADPEKDNRSEGFAETCVAAACWCVAVGWLLEQYGGRPDPRNYDVAGFVHKFVLHSSEAEIDDDGGRQPADGCNSDGGTEAAPSAAEVAAPDDWGQLAGRAESEAGWGARRPVSNSDWGAGPAPAQTAAELAAKDEYMLNDIQHQLEYYVSDVSLDKLKDRTAQELEVSYNAILAAESMVPGTQPEDPEPRRLHNGQLLLEDGQPMDAYLLGNHEARAKICTIPIALLAGYPRLAIRLAEIKELRGKSRPGVPPGSDEGIIAEAVAFSKRVEVVQPGRLRRKRPYDPIEGRKRREQTQSTAAAVRAYSSFGNKRWVVMHLKHARTELAACQAELEALPADNALACERLLRIDKQLDLLVFGTESKGARRGGGVVVVGGGGGGGGGVGSKLRGIAVRWTDRGFGFIKPDDGSPVCASPGPS